MINFHNLKHGDIIKLIPRIVNGEIQWATKVDILMYLTDSGWKNAYDIECNLASRIELKFNSKKDLKLSRAAKYYFNTLTKNGEIKVIGVGRTLMNIIKGNKCLIDLKSNWHLNVNVEFKYSYNVYDNSCPIEIDWYCPFDINSSDQWMDFITKNQPDLETYFKQNDIYSKRSELMKYFGSDVIGQIISEDRGKKLNELGI